MRPILEFKVIADGEIEVWYTAGMAYGGSAVYVRTERNWWVAMAMWEVIYFTDCIIRVTAVTSNLPASNSH